MRVNRKETCSSLNYSLSPQSFSTLIPTTEGEPNATVRPCLRTFEQVIRSTARLIPFEFPASRASRKMPRRDWRPSKLDLTLSPGSAEPRRRTIRQPRSVHMAPNGTTRLRLGGAIAGSHATRWLPSDVRLALCIPSFRTLPGNLLNLVASRRLVFTIVLLTVHAVVLSLAPRVWIWSLEVISARWERGIGEMILYNKQPMGSCTVLRTSSTHSCLIPSRDLALHSINRLYTSHQVSLHQLEAI